MSLSVYKKEIESYSPVQHQRLAYSPPLPTVLTGPFSVRFGDKTTAAGDVSKIKKHFPNTFGQASVRFVAKDGARFGSVDASPVLKIGAVFSGGQAAGGHNCLAGLFDYLKRRNPKSELWGFLDGPSGITDGRAALITEEDVRLHRNQGGFDMIGSGRTKIEEPEQFSNALATAEKMGLDGIVVIGGDDSNTNAAVLGEYFASKKSKTVVVGIPKTIDGDLKNSHVPTSFGFDTACKVFAELVGNICTDCNSARKYWHLVRLMGRSASHVTLEVCLQTHPNISLIGEEVLARNQTLQSLVSDLCDTVAMRSKEGKNFGVMVLPEGLIEFIPQVKKLISELNDVLAKIGSGSVRESKIVAALSKESTDLFQFLPPAIRGQMLLERDPHGNVQVSRIQTEVLLEELMKTELDARKKAGKFKGKFATITHFFGYEGRCSLPSNFDATYCYALGQTAAALVHARMNGYISMVTNLASNPTAWNCGGYPIAGMLHMERRKGKDKPVIEKALVDMKDKAFQALVTGREVWAKTEHYRNPGPIQFMGLAADEINFTLAFEAEKLDPMERHSSVRSLSELLGSMKSK